MNFIIEYSLFNKVAHYELITKEVRWNSQSSCFLKYNNNEININHFKRDNI